MSFDNKRRPGGKPINRPAGRPGGKNFARKPDPMRQLRRDRDDDFAFRPEDENTAFIAGRNAVMEALKANANADTVFIEKGQTGGSMSKIIALAKQAGCPIKEVTSQKLEGMAGGTAHQGVVLSVSAVEYAEVEDILAKAADKGEKPFLIIADDIEDPHNLGAIIRTAETAGAHGVIIPKRRSAGLTAVVAKSSAGAVSYLPVARVPNIPSLLKDLKKQGIWVFGAAAEGTVPLYGADFKNAAAIVIGSEGDGMTRLVRESCDFLVSIPMKGQISSLNASAAAAILLYEAVRQRLA